MNRTVFLSGNGAIAQGWQPITSALQKTFGRKPPQDCNIAFANLTYQLRWLKYQSQVNSEHSEQALAQFTERYELYNQLKTSISKELSNATESQLIHLRPSFVKTYERFKTKEVALATTNWDLLLENHFGSGESAIHIHGDVTSPESLYLPTENIIEPYRDGNSESKEHVTGAARLMSVLQGTERLVIYGLSLSALDIELSILISEGFQGVDSLREIVIVDLDPAAVCERFTYMNPDRNPFCFLPSDI
jgi:hypothetical protein